MKLCALFTVGALLVVICAIFVQWDFIGVVSIEGKHIHFERDNTGVLVCFIKIFCA